MRRVQSGSPPVSETTLEALCAFDTATLDLLGLQPVLDALHDQDGRGGSDG